MSSKQNSYDSSKTRVCPAFTAVSKNPEPFLRLLSDELGIDTKGVELEDIVFSDPENKKKEKSLNPNPKYLRWLLNNPEKTKIAHELGRKKEKGEGLSESDEMRLKLISKDSSTASNAREKGLNGIDDCENNGHYGRCWFVLEGATKPDVFIKTNKFCLIVEGKRTERGPKKDTAWNPTRHQIVRHLEGLRNYVKHEKLNVPAYGIFIVRERDKPKFKKIYDSSVPFEESLPHAREEAEEIKAMYKGCLSWGDIYEAYGGKIKYVDYIEPNGNKVLCRNYDPMD